MSTKHTPGPWTLETVPTSCGICHKVGPFPGKRPDDKPRHACLYADYPSKWNPADDELEANASLIAAAPDLLEALQKRRDADMAMAKLALMDVDEATHERLLQSIEDADEAAKESASSAIAKATGSAT